MDVPICAVFLALFLTSAACNLTIFLTNRRRNHKFLISWVLFVFSVLRIVTCSVRISWATSPTNSDLAIAAQVFNSAGIIIVYIVNMVLAQRILRAKQPQIGWSKTFRLAFKVFCGLLIGTLIMGIVALAMSTSTTSTHTLKSLRSVSLASTTYITTITLLPPLMLAVAFFVPAPSRQESFGVGSMNGKTLLVLLSSCLAITIAGFKTGTTWPAARLANDPAWYHSKAAFYCFNFMLEITILAIFVIFRIDKRFHVPNKCKGPGDYSTLGSAEPEVEEGRSKESDGDAKPSW